MAGMYRTVMLYALPHIYLADVFAQPALEADYQDGSLTVVAKIGGAPEQANGYRVEMQLFRCGSNPCFAEPVSGAYRVTPWTWQKSP